MKESSKPFEHFLHPYVFILKEGLEIQNDFLDYSLLLLQVGKPDTLYAPKHYRNKNKPSNPNVQLLKK